MKHRLLITCALAAAACAVVAATALGGARGRLYQFRGDVVSAGQTSVTVAIAGGNHAALKTLLGNPQTQSFTFGPRSEVLVYQRGVPHVGSVAELHPGDNVTVNVRSHAGATLAELLATPVGTIADHGAHRGHPSGPLYLYAGTVAGAQSGGHIALHVTSGNWRGLKTMLGQPVDQTFSYDSGTIFLLWQGKVPTVIVPSQLNAGDRITVRVRAPQGATLAQIEATPATHVGDHEPGVIETKTA